MVIGDRGLKEGKLEIKWRWEKQSEMIDRDGAVQRIAKMIVARREAVCQPNAGGETAAEARVIQFCFFEWKPMGLRGGAGGLKS